MLIALATGVAGCSGSGSPAAQAPDLPAQTRTLEAPPDEMEPSEKPVTERERYVALGDSYTAGPLVPTTDLANGCLRSDHNYPSLLAARLDLRLRDVSCSGATTGDLVQRQRTVQDASVPPQLHAVDQRTDLVTLGIGGNDLGLFSTLVQACLGLRAQDPSGSPCADSDVGRDVLTGLDRIGDNVARTLDRIGRRAPRARIVLVGYLRIAPATGSCPGPLPFASGDVAFGDRVIRALAAELRQAARTADVDYLDMYTASEGHDVCSKQPWVNGPESTPGVAAAFHPLAAGMAAVADRLEDLLAAG